MSDSVSVNIPVDFLKLLTFSDQLILTVLLIVLRIKLEPFLMDVIMCKVEEYEYLGGFGKTSG